MQAQQITSLDVQQVALAYVIDAHNVGCVVRFVGEQATQRARYSAAIQRNGVVIRGCHMVVVDQRRDPLEVIWRIGTVGAIEAIRNGHVTLSLGYRVVEIPFRDARPDAERARELVTGDRVLLRGRPIEQAAIVDTLASDELSHPERLQAQLAHVIARLATQPED